jgi:hypothetical protein
VGQGRRVRRLSIRKHGEPNAIGAVQGVKHLLGQDIDLENGLGG